MRDAEHRRSSREGQPFFVRLCEAARRDAVDPVQRADAAHRPGLCLACGHAHSVQLISYIYIRPVRRHAPHLRERFFGGAIVVLAGFRLSRA